MADLSDKRIAFVTANEGVEQVELDRPWSAVEAAGGTPELLRFLRWFHRAYLDLLGDWLMFWVWLNAFLIGSVFALLNLLRVRRVLRQEILTGHLTPEVLRAWLGGGKRTRRLLNSLWKRAPLPEHEVRRQ